VEHRTPRFVAIVGASGVGKTAVVAELAKRNPPGTAFHHFDSIGIPSDEEMRISFGGGEGWQEAMTDRWVGTLAAGPSDIEVAVLEGQTRPSFLRAAFARYSLRTTSIILLDCSAEVRRQRLHGPRNQPELANARMESWAAYLRGQADALGLLVVDTNVPTLASVADSLLVEIERLRSTAQ
jgi:ribose 1,5-bisphosphokinase PhnN